MQQLQLRTGWLLVLALFFSLGACKDKNNDGEIQSAIASKAGTDPNLAGVSATVVNGEVTLTGNCATEDCRAAAERSVKDIKGVEKVVNNIMVTPVQVTADEPLRNEMTQVLDRYDGVQGSVSGGVITLRGTIDDREKLQQLMMDLNALRPKRIDNQLVIKD